MMLRIAAGLSLALGSAALLTYLHLMGGGLFAPLEARHLREMKQRDSSPAAAARFTVADFWALPHGLSVGEYSAYERRGIAIEGYVQRMLRAADGDVHLELVQPPRREGGPDSLYVTAEITSEWMLGSPGWSYESLCAEFRPNRGSAAPWPGGPARVRLTGWLLYDYPYDTPVSPWQRAHYVLRATGWEMHPVTRIERWDETLGAYREVLP